MTPTKKNKNICFPVVYKTKDTVAIVYWKRAEYYGGAGQDKGKRIYSGEDYDPFNEVEMLTGNGYKRVWEVVE